MKGLVFFCLLALHSAHSLRQSAPLRRVYSSSSESSMSSEEDSFEAVKPQMKKKDNLVDTFFNRPSAEEMEAYEKKVQMENKERMKPKESVNVQPVKAVQTKMDDSEEKAFLLALDQMYLDMMAQEDTKKNQVQNVGPFGPAQQPIDYDYMVVPVAVQDQSKNSATNNGNNNVHVNVNHVQLNSNVVHAPKKEKGDSVHSEHPPAPQVMYTEPVSTSKYLYLNLNMTDGLVLAVLVVAVVLAFKKVYTRCFPKAQVAPQLPTTLPPTYTPSTIVVESPSKKVVPQ